MWTLHHQLNAKVIGLPMGSKLQIYVAKYLQAKRLSDSTCFVNMSWALDICWRFFVGGKWFWTSAIRKSYVLAIQYLNHTVNICKSWLRSVLAFGIQDYQDILSKFRVVVAFLACGLGLFIIRLRWPQGLLEFIDEKDKMLEEMKGGTPPAEAWRNRVESREASHGYESGGSSVVVFFHWTIPSKGTERRTDAACIVWYCSASKLQAAKWSAACRGQRDIYLWHDKKLQTY